MLIYNRITINITLPSFHFLSRNTQHTTTRWKSFNKKKDTKKKKKKKKNAKMKSKIIKKVWRVWCCVGFRLLLALASLSFTCTTRTLPYWFGRIVYVCVVTRLRWVRWVSRFAIYFQLMLWAEHSTISIELKEWKEL